MRNCIRHVLQDHAPRVEKALVRAAAPGNALDASLDREIVRDAVAGHAIATAATQQRGFHALSVVNPAGHDIA
jgi:hypothetical protein